MKRQAKNRQPIHLIIGLMLAGQWLIPISSIANPLDLATIPLVNSPTVKTQPNLLFVLDDSGSMGWDYMPDWANSGDVTLFRNASYNTLAYNPALRYLPPAYFDTSGLNTTKYPSQTGTSTDTGADTGTKPNWKKVKNDAYLSTSTSDITNDANFYTFIPSEYCEKKDLKVCATQSAPTATNPYPAPVRWCNSSTNASASTPAAGSCQATKTGTFSNLRKPKTTATITITITGASGNPKVNGIKVDGKQIMKAATSGSNNVNTVAQRITTEINNCTNSKSGNCSLKGYSASYAGAVVTISAPSSVSTITSAAFNPVVTGTLNTDPFVISSGNGMIYTQIMPSVTSYPYPGKTAKAADRTDCIGTTCTYAEEMTNYANWYTYYRTRMQTMKSAASLAFKDIGDDFRVGFMTIHPTASNSLKLDTFSGAHKAAWFTEFFSSNGNSATPLRSALAKAGRIYANKETVGGAIPDPVEYACQKNFALLTTDGMWNTDVEADVKGVGSTQVGNLDGNGMPRPYYEGPTTTTNTLADVAKYYHDTDLRTTALGNCTGALGSTGGNVCEDPPPSTANTKQNMVTLTLGMGVDGELTYTSDYKNAASGDFSDIKAGTKDWPVPVQNTPTTVDDLWHAAVNGEGTYFSAKNPTELANSLKEALATVKIKLSNGAAAATSTLNPVVGDNSAYVSSYTTGYWTGNLEKHKIDVETGAVGESVESCVEDVISATSCTSPSKIVADGVGGYDCVTPGQTIDSCATLGGTFVGSDCKKPVAKSCIGVLKNKVSTLADTRTIYMKGGSGLVNFQYSNLSTAQKTYFDAALANLTQSASYTTTQIANLTGENLVNYLRGQTGYDENAVDPNQRLFRKRQATLGDTINSQPAHIGKPTFSYTDAGYADFKTTQSSRPKTVYIAANDGMLHAFDADTMQERWAYVPSMVIPNMWRLADTAYANKHTYLADGSPAVSHVCIGTCTTASDWKTILVGGLNGGGRGYYALDITDPLSPSLLWEMDASNSSEPNLGYSYGDPVITKLPNGKWVVLVTSGYNNIPDNSAFYSLSSTKFKPNNPAQYLNGDGKGYLYVLDAYTGIKIKQLTTGAGDTTTPSGLTKILNYVEDVKRNNTTTYVYGGDLLGNLWRFNLQNDSVLKLAELKAGSIAQPVSTRPQLGNIKGKRAVFVGTGKYLEVSDLINTDQQTIYAIKDDNASTTLVNPRASTNMVQQTIIPNGIGSRKSGTNNTVNWSSGLGWFVDFPDYGERQNIASYLEQGALLVPSIVPTSSACQPAGSGWLSFLDYETGTSLNNTAFGEVSKASSAPLVGVSVWNIEGKLKVKGLRSDGEWQDMPVPFFDGGQGFQKQRSIWRELIN